MKVFGTSSCSGDEKKRFPLKQNPHFCGVLPADYGRIFRVFPFKNFDHHKKISDNLRLMHRRWAGCFLKPGIGHRRHRLLATFGSKILSSKARAFGGTPPLPLPANSLLPFAKGQLRGNRAHPHPLPAPPSQQTRAVRASSSTHMNAFATFAGSLCSLSDHVRPSVRLGILLILGCGILASFGALSSFPISHVFLGIENACLTLGKITLAIS